MHSFRHHFYFYFLSNLFSVRSSKDEYFLFCYATNEIKAFTNFFFHCFVKSIGDKDVASVECIQRIKDFSFSNDHRRFQAENHILSSVHSLPSTHSLASLFLCPFLCFAALSFRRVANHNNPNKTPQSRLDSFLACSERLTANKSIQFTHCVVLSFVCKKRTKIKRLKQPQNN